MLVSPVFRAPWEAQAFALTLTLCRARLLHLEGMDAASERARSRRPVFAVMRTMPAVTTSTGWLRWKVSPRTRGLTTVAEMLARKDEWDRAARSTPHGQPIVLPRS